MRFVMRFARAGSVIDSTTIRIGIAMSARQTVNNVWLMSNSQTIADAGCRRSTPGLKKVEDVHVDVQEHEACPCCCELGLHGHAQIFQRAVGRRIL